MPRKTDGKSLRTYTADVWFAGKSGEFSGQQVKLEVQASNLQGAVGRAARLARKQIKGRFSEATVNVMQVPNVKDQNDSE